MTIWGPGWGEEFLRGPTPHAEGSMIRMRSRMTNEAIETLLHHLARIPGTDPECVNGMRRALEELFDAAVTEAVGLAGCRCPLMPDK